MSEQPRSGYYSYDMRSHACTKESTLRRYNLGTCVAASWLLRHRLLAVTWSRARVNLTVAMVMEC